MTGVLIPRDEDSDTHTHGEDSVKMQGEDGCLQAGERTQGRNQPFPHFDLRLPASGLRAPGQQENKLSVVSASQSVVLCYQSSGKLIQSP